MTTIRVAAVMLAVVAAAACGSSSSGSTSSGTTTTTTTTTPDWVAAAIADCKTECGNEQAATCLKKPLHGLADCEAACDGLYDPASSLWTACKAEVVADYRCNATAKQSCCQDLTDATLTRPCVTDCATEDAALSSCELGALGDAGAGK